MKNNDFYEFMEQLVRELQVTIGPNSQSGMLVRMATVLAVVVACRGKEELGGRIFSSFAEFVEFAKKVCPENRALSRLNIEDNSNVFIVPNIPLKMSPEDLYCAFWGWALSQRESRAHIYDSSALALSQKLVDTIDAWLDDPRNPYAKELKYDVTGVESSFPIACQLAKKGHQVSMPRFPNANDAGAFDMLYELMPNLVIKGGDLDFDGAVHFGPFGSFSGTTELEQCMKVLSQVIVPSVFALSHAALFRSSSKDRDLKRKLVESGRLKAIVLLKEGTILKARVVTALAFLGDRTYDRSILMVDASGDFFDRYDFDTLQAVLEGCPIDETLGSYMALVRPEELAFEDWVLDPKRYLMSEEDKQFQAMTNGSPTMGHCVQLTRPVVAQKTFINETEYSDEATEEKNVWFYEINASDINEIGLIENPQKKRYVRTLEQLEKHLLSEGDVIFTIKGSVGKVAIVTQEAIDLYGPMLLGQSMVKLTCDSIINPFFLHQYLRSRLVQAKLGRFAIGQGIQSIKIKDLEMLPVLVPDMTVQVKAEGRLQENKTLYERIKAEKKQLQAMQDESWYVK